jgi:hypothetical protein
MALLFLLTYQRGQGGLEVVFQPTGKSFLITSSNFDSEKADASQSPVFLSDGSFAKQVASKECKTCAPLA